MKKLFTLLLIGCTLSTFAQCDDSFFPFTEGVSFEQTVYDKKGKEQGKSMSEVILVHFQFTYFLIFERTFFCAKATWLIHYSMSM